MNSPPRPGKCPLCNGVLKRRKVITKRMGLFGAMGVVVLAAALVLAWVFVFKGRFLIDDTVFIIYCCMSGVFILAGVASCYKREMVQVCKGCGHIAGRAT